jgi:hypothetical protein
MSTSNRTVVTFINSANRHKFHVQIVPNGASVNTLIAATRENMGLLDYTDAPLEFCRLANENKCEAALIDGWWGVEGLAGRYEVICDESKPELIGYQNITKPNGKPGYAEATRVAL